MPLFVGKFLGRSIIAVAIVRTSGSYVQCCISLLLQVQQGSNHPWLPGMYVVWPGPPRHVSTKRCLLGLPQHQDQGVCVIFTDVANILMELKKLSVAQNYFTMTLEYPALDWHPVMYTTPAFLPHEHLPLTGLEHRATAGCWAAPRIPAKGGRLRAGGRQAEGTLVRHTCGHPRLGILRWVPVFRTYSWVWETVLYINVKRTL